MKETQKNSYIHTQFPFYANLSVSRKLLLETGIYLGIYLLLLLSQWEINL